MDGWRVLLPTETDSQSFIALARSLLEKEIEQKEYGTPGESPETNGYLANS